MKVKEFLYMIDLHLAEKVQIMWKVDDDTFKKLEENLPANIGLCYGGIYKTIYQEFFNNGIDIPDKFLNSDVYKISANYSMDNDEPIICIEIS